jgi:hypothetical protein
MAAMNGVCSTDFAVDMGFSLRKIIHLEQDALDRLAECGGLTGPQLAELVSWTGRRVGDVRMTFRDEVFGTRSLRKPTIRGCPICLREDMEANLGQPLTKMTMRGHWQVRACSLCVDHQHSLVPLWEYNRPEERYDLSSRFEDIKDTVLAGELEQPRTTPSAYDIWLDTRLATGADETWLAGQSLDAATKFCTLLGAELLRLEDTSDLGEEAQLRRGQALGFNATRFGEDKIREALDALVSLASGHNDEPQKAFGKLYVELTQFYLAKEDFAPFRKIMRDCILDHWPIAPGETVLGYFQPTRKLHSVGTAAREAKIGPALLEQFLVDAGAITADDQRPVSRKTFDAVAYADLLAEVPTLVGPARMQHEMGATRMQFKSLAEDGVIKPRIQVATINFPWRISDGLALVEELLGIAQPVAPTNAKWEGIHQAKKRTGLRVGKIIEALRNGGLQLGHYSNIDGYAGFCVLKAEINSMRPPKLKVADHGLITAYTFGRSVGIRASGWFKKLAAEGHTPETLTPHPKGGPDQSYLSPDDITQFHKRFMTPATMEQKFGQHRKILLGKLRAAGVETFAPNGEDYGPVYLRNEVEAVLE